MRRAVLLASSALAFAACVATQFQDGQFTCDPAGEAACPPGLVCASDGLCRASLSPEDAQGNDAGAPPPDALEAPVGDAGLDAPSPPDASPDACATAMWNSFPDARVPFGVALDPNGRLYAAGVSGAQGWLAELDPCDGRVLREGTYAVPGATDPTTFHAVAATGTDVVVAGAIAVPVGANGIGLYGRFDPTSLQEREPLRTFQGAGICDIGHITVTADGAAWLGGVQHAFDTVNQKGWLVRVSGSGSVQGAAGTSVAGIVEATNGGVYVYVDDQGPQVELVDPTVKVTGKVGPPQTIGSSPAAWGVTEAAGKIYAGGMANGTSPNTYFFVGALDPVGGGWTTTTLDPNPTAPDQVLAMTVTSGALFVGANQRADLANGTPTIYRYELPLAAGAKPTWAASPFGAVIVGVRDIKSRGEALFVAGAALNSSQGGVARCRTTGECAH